MKKTIYISILVLIFGCEIKPEEKTGLIENELNSKKVPEQIEKSEIDLEEHLNNYNRLKQRIKAYRDKLKTGMNLDKELIGKEMSKILIDSIFPFWLGTKWDFNGHTANPLDGEIACGYFVTTTIKDLGININRYKIAQKPASDIIIDLCSSSSIKRFNSVDQIRKYLKSSKNYELMIVGLDFHVGFIFKKEGVNYFAHSNYINSKGVEIELITESKALKQSNLFVLGNFGKNYEMIDKWIK